MDSGNYMSSDDDSGGNEGLEIYFREIENSTPLSRDEEYKLFKNISNGDIYSRESLAKANLKIVITIAKEYEHCGLPLEDLIGAGNYGLMKAVDRFDGNRGCKFVTYAVWWVRQSILETLAKEGRTVRIPNNVIDDIGYVDKTIEELEQELAREPDSDEVADMVKKKFNMVSSRFQSALSSKEETLYLDKKFDDESKESNSLIDLFPNENSESPEEELYRKDVVAKIRYLLETLPEREAQILRLYYGMNGEEPLTLEQIGGKWNITKERVRQLRNRALSSLKHPRNKKILEEFS